MNVIHRKLGDITPPKDRSDVAERNCEHCYFGIWAPVGRVNHSADYCYQCTLQPPKNYNGFPMVRHYAVCALFTEREEPHAQPLRHLLGQAPAANAITTATREG